MSSKLAVRVKLGISVVAALATGLACSESPNSPVGTGGSVESKASGGSTGEPGTGGRLMHSGGTAAMGGSRPASGGTLAEAGARAMGGEQEATGGEESGGGTGMGGSLAVGGASASGGTANHSEIASCVFRANFGGPSDPPAAPLSCTEFEGAGAAKRVEDFCVATSSITVAEPSDAPCSRTDFTGICETADTEQLSKRVVFYDYTELALLEFAVNCEADGGTWITP